VSSEASLPKGWADIHLDDLVLNPKADLVDGPFGSNLKSSEYVEAGVPVLKIQNIKANRFVWKRLSYVTPRKATELSRHSFVAGDLMITKLGEPLGLCCEVPADLEHGVFVADLMRLRPSPKVVHSPFLLHAINSVVVQTQFKEITKGTTRQRVNLSIVRSIRIALPPLAEQRRIVAKIEELFSELDKGIENLKQARAQLAVYRQALLKHAFEGKLTAGWRATHQGQGQTTKEYLASLKNRKPDDADFESAEVHPVESWGFATLDEITDYITSGSRGWADFYSEKGSLFIRAQNLNRDRLDLTDVAYVELPSKAEGKRTQTRTGDVFITITGANVTKAGYLDRDIGEAYVSQHVALCRPLDVALSEYLYLYIIANGGGRRDLERAAYGAGKPGLNLDNIRSLEIPIPAPDEIPILVAEIRAAVAAVDVLEADIDINLQKAEALRQSILKKAFAGELVPQDPNDEPAAALLARIRAERAEQTAAPKLRKLRTEKV
jgi:type I restriction enzyme S subunit